MSTEANVELLKALGSTVGGIALKTLATLGALSTGWATYSASGLPVPATLSQVDARIAPINETLKGVQADVLVNQRATIRISKALLRNEKLAAVRTLESADNASRIAISRRMSEIEDTIADLETEDQELAKTVKALRPGIPRTLKP